MFTVYVFYNIFLAKTGHMFKIIKYAIKILLCFEQSNNFQIC